MSKYIVDTDDYEPLFDVDSIGVFGIGKAVSDSTQDHSWSRIKSVVEFEELNSEYIRDNFGQLLQTAYQKGFEDGKVWSEKGCEGCKYVSRTSEDKPCVDCSNNFDNHWTAKQADEIKVGDIVERYIDGKFDSKGIYLNDADEKGAYWNCLFWTGACFVTLGYPKNQFKKTGRHFDIDKILEEMRHD